MKEKPVIIALESFREQGERINEIICKWRNSKNLMIPCRCPRFSSGEAKGIIGESIRDRDVYILVDVCNSSITYKMDGALNRMSPDDHYQDLKRVIAACNGKAARITVIMPFLYHQSASISSCSVNTALPERTSSAALSSLRIFAAL